MFDSVSYIFLSIYRFLIMEGVGAGIK